MGYRREEPLPILRQRSEEARREGSESKMLLTRLGAERMKNIAFAILAVGLLFIAGLVKEETVSEKIAKGVVLLISIIACIGVFIF